MYVGPFRLVNIISTGQTSQIWEAIHDGERRRVAVKLIIPDKLDNVQIALLRREFSVGKQLNHPNVIKVLELFEGRREPCLVMELFAHPNLKQLIGKGHERLAPLAQKIILNAAQGLAHMHDKGWVHRDVKPDNFLISPEGDVKLIDFALAQKRKTGLAGFFGRSSSIQGTASYMSPEQIRRKAPDSPSDVYSFGCTIYELVTGKLPFTGTSTNELLTKHLRGSAPKLEFFNRNLTPEFSQLVLRMLSKEPSERPELEHLQRELAAAPVFKTAPKVPA
ncbi:MAG: serine/threonine protein kinase [Planctomycetia bacterium]|nr:serine/threonine protein kinase [Planctomycetia bacterium]